MSYKKYLNKLKKQFKDIDEWLIEEHFNNDLMCYKDKSDSTLEKAYKGAIQALKYIQEEVQGEV